MGSLTDKTSRGVVGSRRGPVANRHYAWVSRRRSLALVVANGSGTSDVGVGIVEGTGEGDYVRRVASWTTVRSLGGYVVNSGTTN